MRRWACPNGCAGVLAPDKPRADDVRRYCLKCSEKSGRLVKRTCPALDRKRAASKEKSTAKAKAKRAKEREARLYRGVDIEREAKRLWNLPAMREAHGGRRVPKIEWRRRNARRAYSTGHAWGYRVTMTLGGDAAEAVSVLLHELAHCAIGCEEGHSDRWAALFLNAARQAWGDEHLSFRVPSRQASPIITSAVANAIRKHDAMEAAA